MKGIETFCSYYSIFSALITAAALALLCIDVLLTDVCFCCFAALPPRLCASLCRDILNR
jgi:hypothetical protein